MPRPPPVISRGEPALSSRRRRWIRQKREQAPPASAAGLRRGRRTPNASRHSCRCVFGWWYFPDAPAGVGRARKLWRLSVPDGYAPQNAASHAAPAFAEASAGRRITHHGPASAFTLIEILIAIGLLAMITAAIFSAWTAILRASKVGLDTAASVQRARIVLRTLEDSLGSAQSFGLNLPQYYFVAENGSQASLSFVTRLAKSFPRSGKFGDLDVRRVKFSVEPGPESSRQLVLRQSPLMMELEKDEDEVRHPLVLAKNVRDFEMQFWDTDKNEWVDEWPETKTNQLPRLVMFTIKLADDAHSLKAQEEITRVVALPATTVEPIWQMGRGAPGARPGAPPGAPPGTPPGAPGTILGVPPNGGVPGQPPVGGGGVAPQ